MSRVRREANLRNLCQQLEQYAQAKGIAAAESPSAARLSRRLFLSHATASAKFSLICEDGRLRSADRLASDGVTPRDPHSAEVRLGTAGSVFFFAAPFRYPRTACGMLFSVTLEQAHRDDGAATPFDSGGLAGVFAQPDPLEPAHDFLSRHELPLPDHRDYLALCLGWLFDKPWDYVEGLEPKWPGPIGLTGGDQRRWTHEVRIPNQVWIRTGHLQAVFAPVGKTGDPAIGQLLEWCKKEGIDRITFHTSRGDDFETLRRECVDYIYRKLQ